MILGINKGLVFQSELAVWCITSNHLHVYASVGVPSFLATVTALQSTRDPVIFSSACRQLTQDVDLTLRKAVEVLEPSHIKGNRALQGG